MKLVERIKKYESLNVVFWLIKDSCWMLQLKWLGIIMVVPTVTIATFIVFISWKTADRFINMAILCWIVANSYWMYDEFFTSGQHKLLVSFPFALGFIFIGIFYYQILVKKTKKS